MSNLSNVTLETLKPAKGAVKKRKRLGLGESSGQGKTCGKGHKGHRARSGFKSKPGFEGGQMPLYKRLPKVGFVSRKKVAGTNVFAVISLEKIAKLGVALVDKQVLLDSGLLRNSKDKYKVVGKFELSKKLTIKADAFSAPAKSLIEGKGGEAVIVA